MARSRTCRCYRWPIWHTDEHNETSCLKCGRAKPQYAPVPWRRMLVLAGRLLEKQAA